MIQQLKENIAAHMPMPTEDLDAFCNLFTAKSIRKKEFLLREGEICKVEGFVSKGLFRIYHTDLDAADKVLYFAHENRWVTDIDSFTNQKPSQLCIEALEDSKLLLISKEDKDFAYKNIPSVEKLFRIMTQETHIAIQRRRIDDLRKTADQRYIDFIEKYPLILPRLTNVQIAAYLGITHESLSRIRKKIVSGGSV